MAERLTEIRARKARSPRVNHHLGYRDQGFCLTHNSRRREIILAGLSRGGPAAPNYHRLFPRWSVQAARTAAKKLKQEVDGGHDPMGRRHAHRVAPTLQDVWERYEAEYLPRKAVRAQADERSMWQKIILPRLGKLKVASIDADHIDELHRDVTNVRGTPVRANRVVEVLRTAFIWQSVGNGWQTIPPRAFARMPRRSAIVSSLEPRSPPWHGH